MINSHEITTYDKQSHEITTNNNKVIPSMCLAVVVFLQKLFLVLKNLKKCQRQIIIYKYMKHNYKSN